MKTTPASLTATGWTNTVLIALFMMMLWLPTLDTFFHIDLATLPRENRSLAQFPEFKPGLGSLKAYVAGLEACFNDHFGWRNRLIHWHKRWELGLFPEKRGGSPGVIIGRDGWLFLKTEGMIEHYRGVLQFAPQALLDWQALLEYRRDWLAQRGIKYIFVVAPDKQSVYSEQLPDWLNKVQPDTKLDQLIAHMHAHSTVEVLDLRPALRDARRIAPTYYKTDNHWNFFGSFVAYQEIVKSLSKQQPGLEPLPLTSFNLQNKLTPSSFLADFADLDVNETCAMFLNPRPDLPSLEISSKPGEYSSFGFKFTKNPVAKGSAVVFGDSFGDYLAPFLGYHFGKVTYTAQLSLSKKWIEQEKPDVVITEIVEMYFNERDPKGFDDPGDLLIRRHLDLAPAK
jgi:hypothetical protein